MTRSPPGWAVPALAGALGLWLVIDVVRQNQLQEPPAQLRGHWVRPGGRPFRRRRFGPGHGCGGRCSLGCGCGGRCFFSPQAKRGSGGGRAVPLRLITLAGSLWPPAVAVGTAQAYRKFPQKRWIRRQASSTSSVFTA